MKNILILFIGFLLLSCNETDTEKRTPVTEPTTIEKSTENFDWLIGQWKRLNEEEGKETFENWEKIDSTHYSGIGFTMQNGDTLKQERIWLTKTAENWDLTVKVPQEQASIVFTGASHSENEFTCVNTELDFPNQIKYWKNGNNISATVSGGEMVIVFEFEKLN